MDLFVSGPAGDTFLEFTNINYILENDTFTLEWASKTKKLIPCFIPLIFLIGKQILMIVLF